MNEEELLKEYLKIHYKMLSLGKLRLVDIYPFARIKRPQFYEYALNTSCTSKKNFIEDMTLLGNDIVECESIWTNFVDLCEFPQENKAAMISIFNRYLSENPFKGDIDVDLLGELLP